MAAIPVLLVALAVFRPVENGIRLVLTGDARGLVKLIPVYLMVAATMMVYFIASFSSNVWTS